MTTALDGLGTLADQVAPLLITVDPTRDTRSRLTEDLSNFDTRITGLTVTNKSRQWRRRIESITRLVNTNNQALISSATRPFST
jgi:cytochrome oxidase Cu insertion factor (SCO1/SenC/PrrC family)